MRRLLSILFVGFSLIFSVNTFGQAVDESNRTGYPIFGTFHGSDMDTVSLSNGNLHIAIPLLSLPQRGGRSNKLQYVYDTSSWVLTRYPSPDGGTTPAYWVVGKPSDTQSQMWRKVYDDGTNGCCYVTYQITTSAPCTYGLGGGTYTETYPIHEDFQAVDGQGTRHPFALYQAYPVHCVVGSATNVSSGTALDGSGISLSVDPNNQSSSTIIMKDGSTSGRDSNGNYVGPDTLGRVIPSGYDYVDFNGTSRAFQVQYQSFTIPTTNLCQFKRLPGDNCYESTDGFTQLPSAIILPNGRSYQFQWQYDSTTDGLPDLKTIVLPTGGSISYTYATMKMNTPYGADRYSPVTVRRVVTSRTVTTGSQSYTWTYANSPNGVTSSIAYPSQVGGHEEHDMAYVNGAHTLYETAARYYSSSGALLKTISKHYASEADPTADGTNGNINVRVDAVATTLDTGQTAASETDYETFSDAGPYGSYTSTRLNPSEKREYDYGPGVKGNLLRRTDYTYLHTNNSPYISRNIVDRVLTTSVYDGAGVLAAKTTNEYDNYTPDANHAGLVTTGAVQHDSAFAGGTIIYRANVTAVSRWLNTTGASLTSYMQYDDTGNVLKSIDPGGHTIAFSFADSWSSSGCSVGTSTFAFPTVIMDALGHKVQKTYEPCTGLVQNVKDQNDINAGRTGTTYTYDLMSRSLCTNYPDSGQTCLQYNGDPVPPHATKTVLASPNPSIISDLFYDGLGRLTRTQLTSDPQGADTTDITYDAFGRVLTVSNPYRIGAPSSTDGTTCNGTWNNGVCISGYDAIGRLTVVTKQDGNTVSTSFSGNITTSTDEAGNQRRIYNDASGRVVEVDEPATQSSGYVDFGGTERVVTIPGTSGTAATATVQISGTERSVYVCVSSGRNRCDPSLSYTSYDYGTVSVTANGFTKQVNYGSSSTSSTIASALATQFNSDGSSPVTASSSGSTLYLSTKLLAQAANNYTLSAQATTSVPNTFPGGSFSTSASSFGGGSDGTPTQTIYDSGTVQVAVNGESHSVSYGQNSTPANIASALANAFAASTYVTASASGSRLSFTSKLAGPVGNYSLSAPAPVTTQPSYFAGASFSSTASGNTLSTGLSSPPYVTQYQYDSLDNLTCAVQKGTDTTTFSSCASAPTTWRPRSFGYDSLSRLTSSSNPESGSISYSYAADTNCNPGGEELRTKTDARGLVTTYCYDPEHRATQKSYSNSTPVVYFSYDVAPSWMTDLTNIVDRLTYTGNQFAGTAGAGTATTNSYDPRGRLLRQWQQTPSDAPGGVFVYASYDLAGDLNSITYPSGRVIKYQYDAAAHLYKTYSTGSTEYDYLNISAFWPSGSWQNATYGNGTRQQDTYNARLQPTELNLLNSGNGTIADRQYVWTGCSATGNNGNAGNVCYINDVLNSGRNQSYSYDALNRIVSGTETDGAFNQAMSYDPWGNASIGGPGSGGRSFNTKNQDNAYGFDAAGNLTNDGTYTYAYNAEEQISSFTSNSNGAQVANYVYDADSNRVRKNVGSSWTEYIYFGSNVIAENSPSGWTDYIFAGGKRIAQVSASGTQYYWADHLGTTKMTLDASGNSQCYAIYTPFGSEVSGCPTHYKLTGKERDSEDGLDYFGARYYSSNMGRWMSPDWADKPEPVPYADLSDPQSLNLYGYVRNNPMSHTDANGHKQVCGQQTTSTDANGTVTVNANCHDEPDDSLLLRIGTAVGSWVGMEFATGIKENRAEAANRAARTADDLFREWEFAVMLGTASEGGTFRNLLNTEEQVEFESLRARYPEWMPKNGLDSSASIRSVEENANARAEVNDRGHHSSPLKFGGEPNPSEGLVKTGETRTQKNPIHTEVTNFWNRVLRRIQSESGAH